jgi:hypothetical protein
MHPEPKRREAGASCVSAETRSGCCLRAWRAHPRPRQARAGRRVTSAEPPACHRQPARHRVGLAYTLNCHRQPARRTPGSAMRKRWVVPRPDVAASRPPHGDSATLRMLAGVRPRASRYRCTAPPGRPPPPPPPPPAAAGHTCGARAARRDAPAETTRDRIAPTAPFDSQPHCALGSPCLPSGPGACQRGT